MLLATILFAASPAFGKSTRVKGHTTKGGKYVPTHYRTTPNKSKYDNWSTKGNVNPHTGKRGTKSGDR